MPLVQGNSNRNRTMKPLPRDGVINANGLMAEFRFVACDAAGSGTSAVDTATGPVWVEDSLLTWDPPCEVCAAREREEKP